MSDSSDVQATFEQHTGKEQASTEVVQELARNLLHRVAVDGSKDFNLLQYIQGIAATLATTLIRGPDCVAVVAEADTEEYILIKGLPGFRIVVFDILLSINAPSIITLIDNEGNNLLAPMYAPNAGQGYTMNSTRGKWLPSGKGLIVTSSNAINYGIDVSYTLVEG